MTYVRSTRTGRIDVTGDGTRAIMVGDFGQATNLIVTSAANYPVGVFARLATDENTTQDIRCAWFRLRVDTTVQIGNSANWGKKLAGIQGSLKFYGGSGSGTYCWSNSGVFGSIETDGATKVAFRDGSVTAGVFAHVGLLATSNDDVDIETGAVVAGVAINCGTSTASNVTVAGKFCGLYIYNDVGNQSFNYGIFIADPAIQYAIMIGESGTSGMTTTQTNRAHLGVFGYIGTAISTGSETMRCIRARMQIDKSITSNASTYPIQSYIVVSANTVTLGAGAGSNTFGVMAGFETSGSSLVLAGWSGGVVAYLSAATGWTLNAGCVLAGFMALSNTHDTNTIDSTAQYAAFMAYKYSGKEPWTYGVYMANDAATHVMGFSDGTGLADANGMSGSKAMNILSHWDGWIRIDIGGTDHYIPTCLDPTSS